MPKFREFEISKFLGIASSNRHPQKNECQECKNFDTRYIDGDLTLRPGFTQKYAAPASADHRGKLTIPSSPSGWLAFQNFYVPDNSGKEITVWIGKGTLAGETSFTDPGVEEPTSINIGLVFTSHQLVSNAWAEKNWDGSTTGKYWLNHTILTKIQAVGATTSNYQLDLDFADATLAADGLNNWTIVNITKSPYEIAHIIDTANAGSNQVQVHITTKAHTWTAGDTVVIMKNYIPYDVLKEMYNATANEINFHKVLNDLRVGYGGKADRLGLSIGYRKKYWRLASTEMGSPDITAISTINNLILDVYNGDEQDIVIDLETVSGGGLAQDTLYQFKLIGVLDDFNKILLAENSIEWTTTTYDINVNPKIRWGTHNKRLTSLELYGAAGENGVFYLLNEYKLSNNSIAGTEFVLKDDGYLYLEDTFSDLHTASNAASSTSEANATTGWTGYGNNVTLASVSATPTPENGTYALKLTHAYSTKTRIGAEYAITLQSDNRYNFNFEVYTSSAFSITLSLILFGPGGRSYKPLKTIFIPATTWTNINETFFVPEYGIPGHTEVGVVGIAIDALVLPTGSGGYFAIDDFHIYQETSSAILINQSSFDNADEEIAARLGYTPTANMVRSWDQAIVTQGRTFFVNPYIDKRYENKIFRSHISGAGAFMYDVASAEEYIDLENFDGNSLVGLEILPNMWFIALKTNGSQLVDPNTGATKSISFGDGCISRRSIVNFGDRVVWCGENDIYMSDGRSTISIAEKSIRETYRALTTKSSIIATREEKDNAYRFFTGDTTNRTEYILTKKGWVKRVNTTQYPDGYMNAQNGTVWFMRSGIIYYDDTTSASDNGSNMPTPEWQSILIDAETIGEGLTARDFIGVNEMWVYCYSATASDFNLVMDIFLDGSGTAYKSKTTLISAGYNKIFIPFTTANCRRFSLKVSLNVGGLGVYGPTFKLISVGVMWTPIKAEHYN